MYVRGTFGSTIMLLTGVSASFEKIRFIACVTKAQLALPMKPWCARVQINSYYELFLLLFKFVKFIAKADCNNTLVL